METLDLQKIGAKIQRAKGNPGLLDEINIDLSGWYAYFSEQFIRLEHQEAVFYQVKEMADEKPTIKSIESQWKISEEGQDHVRTKQTLKVLEKLMSNIKASIRRAETESKNQF